MPPKNKSSGSTGASSGSSASGTTSASSTAGGSRHGAAAARNGAPPSAPLPAVVPGGRASQAPAPASAAPPVVAPARPAVARGGAPAVPPAPPVRATPAARQGVAYDPSAVTNAADRHHVQQAVAHGNIPADHTVTGVHRYAYQGHGNVGTGESQRNSSIVRTRSPGGSVYSTHLHEQGARLSRWVRGDDQRAGTYRTAAPAAAAAPTPASGRQPVGASPASSSGSKGRK